ncbi:MAG: transposase [Chloroflexota bacterium]|nr:transposase [Chloroflexota bacterium]
MRILPDAMIAVLRPFAQAFTERTWEWVQILVVGAILAPGRRTVTAILRVMGLRNERQFQRYHRVLNRVKWSGLLISRILVTMLVAAFVAAGMPVVIAADETLERRNGDKIGTKGVFRDAVRSSKKHVVYCFGLRWISMMLLVAVPWSPRVWALPFLTVLAPSAKTNQTNGKRHKTSIDWIGQMIRVVRRWLPDRAIVLVVDGGLAAVKLGLRCCRLALPVTYVSRLRLDAALYDPPAVAAPGKRGPKAKKGARQPSLQVRLTDPTTVWTTVRIPWYGGSQREVDLATGTALWYTPSYDPLPVRWVLVRDRATRHPFVPQAFFATDQDAQATQIVAWFVLRWNEEVTFEEVRAHLGVETQRQWSDLAIARTTPALLGMFSLITLLGYRLTQEQPMPVRTAAWYTKQTATFSDVIALVRREVWTTMKYTNSACKSGYVPISHEMLHGLIDTFCYAT